MKRKNGRKAFTIVELVIVIAVIAILATVLIPTFGDIIQKAQDSAAKQEAKNAYTNYFIENDGAAAEYMIYEAKGRFVALLNGAPVGVYESQTDALKAMVGDSASIDKLTQIVNTSLWIYSTSPAIVSTDWSGASAVFVGDSITEATQHTSKFYYQYVKDLLKLDTSIGMGKSSSCISNNCTNTAVESLYDRYKNIPTNQDLIVIFMGTNDYGHAAELGEENSTDPNNFYGSLNIILPYLVEQHPTSQIVVMTPLHRNGFRSSGMSGDIGEGAMNDIGNVLLDYVNALKKVCTKNNIPVIDLYTLVTLDPTDKTYFNDGLHPNLAGHEKIADIIAEELKNIPRKKNNDYTETKPSSEFENGNKFSAGYEYNTHSATSLVNLWLTKDTVVEMKDITTYQWALAPTTSANTKQLKAGVYYHSSGWTSDTSCTIKETGWYGFIIKIKDGNTGVDYLDISEKKLTDFFDIREPAKNPANLALKHGNKNMVGNSTYYNASYTASTIKNIWLEKGTFVRIKDNITYEWTLLNTENATNEQGSYLPNSGWTTGTGEDSAGWTISESGYYGFIFKLASGNGTLDFTNKDLLDYFEIITPNSPQ